MRVTYGGGGTREDSQREIPQVAGEYFEIGTPPAYGLYARNVRGLSLTNVSFGLETPDLRPAVVLDHVTDSALNGLSVAGNEGSKAVLRFAESQNVLVTAPRVLTPAAVFLNVQGAASRGIVVEGGDISQAAAAVVLETGATKAAVKVRA